MALYVEDPQLGSWAKESLKSLRLLKLLERSALPLCSPASDSQLILIETAPHCLHGIEFKLIRRLISAYSLQVETVWHRVSSYC